jgi:hypothetical protein
MLFPHNVLPSASGGCVRLAARLVASASAALTLVPAAWPADVAKAFTLAQHAPAGESRSVDAREQQAFNDARAALNRDYVPIARLRETDPARHAAETDDWLRRAGALIDAHPRLQQSTFYRREVADAAQQLAPLVRFALRDAGRAAALYRRAIAWRSALPDRESLALEERIGLADTLRFDLRDPAAALALYRDTQDRLARLQRSTNDPEAAIDRALAQWLGAEIAWLAGTRRHAGVLDRETLQIATLAARYGAEAFTRDDPALRAIVSTLQAGPPADGQRRTYADRLDELAPSQGRLIAAFDYLPVLDTPARVASFMRRHDPAGFVSAALFATRRAAEQPGSPANRDGGVIGWNARERDLMRSAEVSVLGRASSVGSAPAAKLSSPEATWAEFLAALRTGRLDDAWRCTTPGIRNKLEPAFSAMTPSQRVAMADAMTRLRRTAAFGEFVEAAVEASNGSARIVTFVRQGNEWRITEM